ncbi:MAG: hypothetical protein ACXU93_07965 [Thermodesulfobacteriota bacterium]
MTMMIEKKVYEDGEPYYLNTETGEKYGEVVGGLAWPDVKEGFLVIAAVDLFEDAGLAARHIRVLAEASESNIDIFLRYALELQKRFSPFLQTIRFYGDTTSLGKMELLDQFNKDRRERNLDPFYVTEAPQLRSPQKLEFYAQLIRTYTQPGKRILHFRNTTLPGYLASVSPSEITDTILDHPPIAALGYAVAALSTWKPRKGEKRSGKEEAGVERNMMAQ